MFTIESPNEQSSVVNDELCIALLLLCVCPGTSCAPPAQTPSFTQKNMSTSRSSPSRCAPPTAVVDAAIEAIYSELRSSEICHGGERIEIAMANHPARDGVLEIVYRVPWTLQVYREAYVQPDGLVILADGLDYRHRDVRYSMHPIDEETFERWRAEYAIRSTITVPEVLSDEQWRREIEREERKEEWNRLP